MKHLILAIVMAGAAGAQDINLLQFDTLKSKASDSVEVNLSEPMLRMAIGFLADNDPKQVEVKKLVGGLKGIYVRSFKFDKDGQYSAAEIEALRAQLKGAGWQSMVDVHSKKTGGDNAGVYMRTDGKQMTGLVVLALEPRELTVVNFAGSIDPAQIQALSGTLGIPNFSVGYEKAAEKKSKE